MNQGIGDSRAASGHNHGWDVSQLEHGGQVTQIQPTVHGQHGLAVSRHHH